MRIEPIKGLEDVLIIKPDLHEDERGYFYEVFNEREFNEKTGNKYDFHVLQENESKSSSRIFRGFHFQNPPYEQAKLVRVLEGTVIDFAIDIRKDSPTFGKAAAVALSSENKAQFFIPRGFAHGFLVPEFCDRAVFEYKCDNYYNKESEDGLSWNCDDIVLVNTACEATTKKLLKMEDGNGPILSEKDKNRTKTLKDL